MIQSWRMWLLVLAIAFVQPSHAHSRPVDLALVLAIDVSASVDAHEFRLQLNGLAHAFRSPDLVDAIARGPSGAIAVTVLQWSSGKQQEILVPWQILRGSDDTKRLAQRLERGKRLATPGGTSISGAITMGLTLQDQCPCLPGRRVIDISADGRDSYDYRVTDAKTLALASNVTINGLAIINEIPTLNLYFEKHVITGLGAFVEIAQDYRDFERAIERKLVREVTLPLVSTDPTPRYAQARN